jgi:hypothetical protein
MSFSPGELLQGNYCIYEVSKDLNGQVILFDGDYRACSSPSCNPLVQQQFLRLDATSSGNPNCDSQPPGMALDGAIRVRNFATVFAGPKENLRGVHAGQFDWTPIVGGLITGTLEGISNAGILRAQIFSPHCERCYEPGIVCGHLFGTGRSVQGVPAPDFHVEAMYRLAWDPLAWDPANPQPRTAPVRGTLEGVLIVACQ